MFIRKFFDADAKESSGFVIEGALDPQVIFEQNNNIVTEEAEPEPSEAKIEDTGEVKSETIPEEVKTESEKQPESEAEPVHQTATTEIKQEQNLPDWKELVLTNKDEAYNLLGVKEDELALAKEVSEDEFLKKVIAYRKEHGNVTAFLEAAGKDWDKVSDLDLWKDEFRLKHLNLPKEKFDRLANIELRKRFGAIEDELADPDEKEAASLFLESEAAEIRNKRKAEQQSFLDKYQPKDTKAEQMQLAEKQEAERLKSVADYQASIDNLPSTKALLADKKIVIGVGKEAYNYEVNPATILDVVKNPSKLFGLLGEAGKEDYAKFKKLVAFAVDMDKYDAGLINHGRSLGTETVVEEDLSNKENPGAKTSSTQTKKESLGTAFATRGVPFVMNQ